MKLYHGSKDWFERPSENFAGVGDGRSMYGLGFYFGTSHQVCKEHLNNRLNDFGQNPDYDAVIYEAELAEDAGILRYATPVERDLISRAEAVARKVGDNELAGNLAKLGRGMDAGTDIDDLEIAGRQFPTIKDGKVKTNDFRRLVEEAYPDQRLQNQFLKTSGIHVIESYEAFCVIDYSKIGPMKVAEVIGKGPEDMPDGMTAGDLTNPQAKINTSEQIAQGRLYSETFSDAYREVKSTGNPTLLAEFKQLADLLVSDRFIAADQFRQTREQNNGFAIRDGMGHAIGRILRDVGAENEDDYSGRNTWRRQADWITDEFGPDNPVTPLVDSLRHSIDMHNDNRARVTEALADPAKDTAVLFQVHNPDDYTASFIQGLEAIRATGDADAVLAGRRMVRDLWSLEDDSHHKAVADQMGKGLIAMSEGQKGAADKMRHDARISRAPKAEDMVMATSFLDRSLSLHRKLEAQRTARAEKQMTTQKEV
ncbi:MAG: hypothetical protein Alpg2KO_03630 [Alphaproteobacteria bacterium]